MRKTPGLIGSFLLAAALLLTGCGSAPSSAPQAGAAAKPDSSSRPEVPASSELAESVSSTAATCWFDTLTRRAVNQMGFTGHEDDFEKVRAAYLYVIGHTDFIEYDQPELVDSWRWLDECGATPTVYEVMAAGPLAYGFGTCEHFSAALVVLLRYMGFDALYVPGLTYSVNGALVDHAWAMVNIGGAWYHIDPQLEWNVMKDGQVLYRYYLKNDTEFAAHHVWGGLLASPDPYSKTLPACTGVAAAPAAEPLQRTPTPDVAALVAQARAQRQSFGGKENTLEPEGELPPLPGEWLQQQGEWLQQQGAA